MPSNMLYVPTNRRCTDQIGQLAEEALVIRERTGACLLALIEHSDAPWSAEHREALAAERDRHGFEVVHMTRSGAAPFLREVVGRLGLAAADAERLMNMLNPDAVAYGAGPNKAALVAAAAGCRVLHRRDSDVRIDRWQEGPAYPCVAELNAIGKRPAELGVEAPVTGRQAYATVQFAGTSSFGNSPHDRRDLLAVDERFLVDIELLAAPHDTRERLLGELRQYLMIDPEVRYTEDFFELDTTGRTVMLACAMADIFLELPEMPIRGTLGSDYMRRNTLRYLGSPIIFHSRKVSHRYDEARAQQADLAAVIDYAQRDLRHMLLWPVVVRHHRTLREAPDKFITAQGTLDRAAYVASLHAALHDSAAVMEGMPARFAAIYRTAAGEAGSEALAARLRAVAQGIESGPDFVREVADGVADFAFLIGHWPALIESAAASGAALRTLYV